MDKPERPPPNANATIQLDQFDADAVVLDDGPEASEAQGAGTSKSRAAPPPLPPDEIARARSRAPAAQAKTGRGPLLVVLFVAGLALAITLGIVAGKALRGQPAQAASASAQPMQTATQAATQKAPPQTITLPTVEMNDQPGADR